MSCRKARSSSRALDRLLHGHACWAPVILPWLPDSTNDTTTRSAAWGQTLGIVLKASVSLLFSYLELGEAQNRPSNIY